MHHRYFINRSGQILSCCRCKKKQIRGGSNCIRHVHIVQAELQLCMALTAPLELRLSGEKEIHNIYQFPTRVTRAHRLMHYYRIKNHDAYFTEHFLLIIRNLLIEFSSSVNKIQNLDPKSAMICKVFAHLRKKISNFPSYSKEFFYFHCLLQHFKCSLI